MPISRLATESRPSQAQCSSWQLATAVERSGRSGPPSCGGTPPATPPLVLPPCLRDSSSPPTPPCVRGSRSSNHESRVTAVMAVPALPRAGGLLPQRSPVLYHRACAIPACRRRASHVDATMRARLPQFESRITSHESRLRYTTVSARFQLAADAPVMSTPPCVRDSSSPSTPPCVRGSRSSNHESRVTAVMAVPALPRAGGLPPQRPPVLCRRACAPPACRQRAADTMPPSGRITSQSRLRPAPPPPAVPGYWPLTTGHRPLLTIHYPLSTAVRSAPSSRRPFAQYQILSIINRAVEPQYGRILSAPTICSATRTGPASGLGPGAGRVANRQHP